MNEKTLGEFLREAYDQDVLGSFAAIAARFEAEVLRRHEVPELRADLATEQNTQQELEKTIAALETRLLSLTPSAHAWDEQQRGDPAWTMGKREYGSLIRVLELFVLYIIPSGKSAHLEEFKADMTQRNES